MDPRTDHHTDRPAAPAAPVELVVFDCDGVLVDSERLAITIDARMVTEVGWPMDEAEVVERFTGLSEASMFALVEEHIGRPLTDDWHDRFQAAYRHVLDTELTAVPGIFEALDALDAAGIPTCVASSGTHERMRRTLGRTGLYDRFDGRIFSASEVEHGKPAPDLFLHAATKMGAEPEACAVVEDSAHGVQAARSAGMRAFGYAGSVTPGHCLAGPGTVVFDDMRDLPALLGFGTGTGRNKA
jgi:HAD superfamily hydrolase (TIGR01509 family)